MKHLARIIVVSVSIAATCPLTVAAQQRCRQRDPELAQEVQDLIHDVEEGRRPELTSVDKFLAAVPEKIRQSMIFVGDSRSLQESSREAPRILIKSPNSDVIMSFNIDPSHRGYESVEMVLWNGDTARIEMVEVRFPEDTTDPTLRASGKPMVTHNPRKCQVCHFSGTDMRWQFDPYRFWAGHIPWTEDALNEGSIEVEWYKEFLRNINEGKPRWRNLVPFETEEQIDRDLARNHRVQIRSTVGETTQPNNTPSLDLSHQILIYNGCRIGWSLADRPDWDKIKYAATAAVTSRCSDPTQFMDEDGNRQAEQYFEDRGLGLKNHAFDYDTLLDETHERQWSLAPDREGRQLWFFEKYLGSEEAARAEIDQAAGALLRKDAEFTTASNRFPTFENGQDEVTKTRYLLQPLGIDVDQWSMAIDPNTYSHVEFFDEVARSKPITDVVDEINADRSGGSFCEKLAAKSRAALRDVPRKEPEFDLVEFCSAQDIVGRALELAQTLEPAALRAGAEEAVSGCPGCHATRALGAPPIPFHDMNALEAQIRKTQGKLGSLGDRIWDRVSRHPEVHGAMPKFGSGLSTEDKTALRAWLDSLAGPSS